MLKYNHENNSLGGIIMSKHFGYDFLKYSSYQHMSTTDQQKGLPQPPLELSIDKEKIILPKIDQLNFDAMDIKDAIINRKSNRGFSSSSISLDELSYALYMTQGVKKIAEQRATFRTVPSAGARHPFETYIIVNHVSGLLKGLYKYCALTHELALIEEDETLGEAMAAAALNQSMIKDAAVTFIWVADSYRTCYRYGERGYRYIFLDAGHVCQNLYLVAEQLGFGTCGIAAFDDEKVNLLLKIDGKDYFTVYMAPFGKIK